jgi:DNA-binding transcriptional ArsR family regulator
MDGEKQDRLNLMLHPVRLRILMVLAGTEQTSGEIARALGDVPASSVYRHLRTLISAGLIEVVAERHVRGTVERTLRVTAANTQLAPEELARMTADDHRRGAVIFVTQLLSEFDRYLQQPDFDLQRDLAGLRTVTLYATDEEWLAAIAGMNAALLPLLNNAPGDERVARRLASITFPVARAPDQSDKGEDQS